MKLWLLRPVESVLSIRKENLNPWEPWYDKAFGFVVRAPTEEKARAIAAESCRDEGQELWLNPGYSTCTELLPKGEEGMIIEDVANA
jgi:hypothetical protein